MASVPPPIIPQEPSPYPRGSMPPPPVIGNSLADFNKKIRTLKSVNYVFLTLVAINVSVLGLNKSTDQNNLGIALLVLSLVAVAMIIGAWCAALCMKAVGKSAALGVVAGAILVLVPFGALAGAFALQMMVGKHIANQYGLPYAELKGFTKAQIAEVRQRLNQSVEPPPVNA